MSRDNVSTGSAALGIEKIEETSARDAGVILLAIMAGIGGGYGFGRYLSSRLGK